MHLALERDVAGKKVAKNKIKEVAILNKIPLNSIQKYGIEAKNG